MSIEEVKPEHFTTLSRNPLPHIEINNTIMQIAGGGPAASDYHKQVLAAAGWPHHNLIPFAKHPAEASAAYNRVREVLNSGVQNQDGILAALNNGKEVVK